MAAIVNRDISLSFSSRESDGARNISLDGSTFGVNLSEPLRISGAAVVVSAALAQASIWHVSPNISAAKGNNLFSFTTTDPSAPGSYTFTIPAGLYALGNLNQTLALQLQDAGLPQDLFELAGDLATSSVILTVKRLGDVVRVGAANSVFKILGWPPGHPDIVSTEESEWDYSPQQASLNSISRYILVGSLFSAGIPLNGESRQVLGIVGIDVSPGSLLSYAPNQLLWFNANELRNNSISNITFSLRDQSLNVVDTFGEAFDFTIIIRVGILLSATGPLPMNLE